MASAAPVSPDAKSRSRPAARTAIRRASAGSMLSDMERLYAVRLGLARSAATRDVGLNELVAEFKKGFVSISCKELLCCDLNTDEGQKKHQEENRRELIRRKCVEGAARIAEALMRLRWPHRARAPSFQPLCSTCRRSATTPDRRAECCPHRYDRDNAPAASDKRPLWNPRATGHVGRRPGERARERHSSW